MFIFNNLMLLIPETYNCAIHTLITGFIKMLIYGSLQAVWSRRSKDLSLECAEKVAFSSCQSVSVIVCISSFENDFKGLNVRAFMNLRLQGPADTAGEDPQKTLLPEALGMSLVPASLVFP